MTNSKTAQLPILLKGLHDRLVNELGLARTMVSHPSTKGELSENYWIAMLRNHLPARYQVSKAFVVDSRNRLSDQIDVVIHDRQYSPFVLNLNGALYVPAESVYAIFEVKQEMSADEIAYAADKIASVRCLHRTSMPIPHAGGTFDPKPPQHIIGGLLCLCSSWRPPFGDSFGRAIAGVQEQGRLDLGCAAENGVFEVNYSSAESPRIVHHLNSSTLAFFLLRLIAQLQSMATVPCLDVMAYAQWLDPSVDVGIERVPPTQRKKRRGNRSRTSRPCLQIDN
jgi:hypothetical protein